MLMLVRSAGCWEEEGVEVERPKERRPARRWI